MRLPRGADFDEFVELRFKPGTSEESGIPQEGCWMRSSQLQHLLERGGGINPDDLIYGLMDWLDVTDDPLPATRTLRMVLDRHYPADGRASARVSFVDEHGVERVFLVGAIDCTSELVAWQRRQWVIAVAQRSREPGRMIVAAPGPISLAVAQRILAHSFLIYRITVDGWSRSNFEQRS